MQHIPTGNIHPVHNADKNQILQAMSLQCSTLRAHCVLSIASETIEIRKWSFVVTYRAFELLFASAK